MKKFLCALLALALCLPVTLAGAECGADAPAPIEAQSEQAPDEAPPVEPGPVIPPENSVLGGQSAPEGNGSSGAPDGSEGNGAPGGQDGSEMNGALGEQDGSETGGVPDTQGGSQTTGAPTEPEGGENTPNAGGDPSGEPSTQPSDDPSTDPSDGPSTEPTDSPSTEPSEDPSTEPTGSPTVDPSASSTPSPEGEGYYVPELGKDRVYGTLEELLMLDGEKTIYIFSLTPVTVPQLELVRLQDVDFQPDPEVFKEPGVEYIVTLRAGEEEILPEKIENATDEVIDLTVAVEKKPEPTATPGQENIHIAVDVRNFAGNGVWQCEIPEFQLSGIPAGSAGYSYVAIVYDERFIPLSGDCYLPLNEGVYSLRFAILDEKGDVVNGASEKYEPWLDYTPPALNVEVSATLDYTMTLSAVDELSGVVELSLDGGQSWTGVELGERLSVVHTEPKAKIFPAGMIRVRDQAGNESWNTEDVALDKVQAASGWGGGGGGGEPSATAAPHASGDGDDAPYAAYELELPEGPVEVLTLGGEEINLGLEIEADGEEPERPARFTAALTTWASEDARAHVADAESAKDTLVIRSASEPDGAYACSWRINGSVLRKLYNSDIHYLALVAGDAVLGLPTVGFTAGTKYAELKMQGVSTAEFEYIITMRIDPEAQRVPAPDDWNLASNCEVEIEADVGEERYQMLDRLATPEMYPIDLCCGPEDLTDYPYGEYPLERAED